MVFTETILMSLVKQKSQLSPLTVSNFLGLCLAAERFNRAIRCLVR